MFKKIGKAQITVETSIVLPIVITVIAGFLYISLYIHDIISIRSRVYSFGIEYAFGGERKMEGDISSHLFVIRPQIKIDEKLNDYCVEIVYTGKGKINFINQLINKKEKDYIEIQKTISREVLYSSVAVKEKFDKGKE